MVEKHIDEKNIRKRRRNAIITTVTAIIIAVVGVGLHLYNSFMSVGIFIPDGKAVELYIPTGATFEQLTDTIKANLTIEDIDKFEFLAKKKGLTEKIRPGHYVVKNNTNYNSFINMLLSGRQTPINVKFNNMQNTNQLTGRIARQIEADSASIAMLLHDKSYVDGLGFDTLTIASMFIPNTYEFYWNTNANDFIKRMKKEYDSFWNGQRKSKADSIGLSPIEVSILASIVEKETSKTDEMPRIAGVYLNRLAIGMPLQADPTLLFILNDPEIHRVLNEHKELKSPYNTYQNAGLPPGPICIPSIAAIDGVLNHEHHKYLYFCAKEDFSGYHNFAKTLSEHNRNAAKYQRELNNRNIFR